MLSWFAISLIVGNQRAENERTAERTGFQQALKADSVVIDSLLSVKHVAQVRVDSVVRVQVRTVERIREVAGDSVLVMAEVDSLVAQHEIERAQWRVQVSALELVVAKQADDLRTAARLNSNLHDVIRSQARRDKIERVVSAGAIVLVLLTK